MAKAAKVPAKKAFMTPTVRQVADYMNLRRPNWPTAFVEFYAQKFMDFYVSKGWIVGKVKMKSWEATIACNWLEIKFKEDKDALERFLMEPIHQMHAARMRRESAGMYADELEPTVGSAKPIDYYIQFYDVMMGKYIAGQVKERELASHYDRLKKMGLMRLPKPQIDQILVDMGNDRDRGKGMSVARLFLNLQARNMTLKQYFTELKEKMQPKQP
jgi:hypothetical protein